MELLQQFGHLPFGIAALFVFWKLAHVGIKAWKEVTAMRLEATRSEQDGHRQERLALMKGFKDVEDAVKENTEACREQTSTLRAAFGILQVRRQG